MFDRMYAINVKGVLYSYRAAAKAMIPRGGGRIVGASSAAGVTGYANYGAYGCSKSSVRTLTQTAAREWGRHNITVNAYAPGFILTDMSKPTHERVHICQCTDTGLTHAAAHARDADFGGNHGAALKTVSGLSITIHAS